jgi:hypothetical protein
MGMNSTAMWIQPIDTSCTFLVVYICFHYNIANIQLLKILEDLSADRKEELNIFKT